MIIQFPTFELDLRRERKLITERLEAIQQEANEITAQLQQMEAEALAKAAKFYELSTEGVFLITRKAYIDSLHNEPAAPLPFPIYQLEIPYVY